MPPLNRAGRRQQGNLARTFKENHETPNEQQSHLNVRMAKMYKGPESNAPAMYSRSGVYRRSDQNWRTRSSVRSIVYYNI